MKVYLQNTQTRAYCQGYGKWTSNRELAWNFQNVMDALDWAQNVQIDLEVVLGLDDGQQDVRLSLGCIAPSLPRSSEGLYLSPI